MDPNPQTLLPAVSLRRATAGDAAALIAYARAFHEKDGHALKPDAEAALAALIAEPREGFIWIIEAARASGRKALHLEVMPDNDGAERLYARLGFADHGSRMMSLRLGT